MIIHLQNKKTIKKLNNKLIELQKNKDKIPKYLSISVKVPKAIIKKILPENLDIKYLEKINKKIKKKKLRKK